MTYVTSELKTHGDMLCHLKVNVTAIKCPLWSSSCDAHLDSNIPGLDPPLREGFFRIVSVILPTAIFG